MANGSTYLRKQLANSDQKKWTLSVWVKRADVGNSSTHKIFGSGTGNYEAEIAFNGNDKFSFYAWNGGAYAARIQSNAVYMDTSGWYHVVMRWDTANATSGERMRAYINGQELTSLQTNTVPSQNTNSEFNANSQHEIGASGSGSGIFSGWMSHMHFCDGQSYAPTEFGKIDSTTGEWSIITQPSVTYGTQGFFLFKDDNSVTDQSGQGNNWVVQAGTLTKSEDNPSNVFNTINPRLQGDLTNKSVASYGNNRYSSVQTGYGMMLGTLPMHKGKWYWEAKYISQNNHGNSDSHGLNLGFTGDEMPYGVSTSYVGKTANSYQFQDAGMLYNNNATTTYSSGATAFNQINDIGGVALDLDNNKAYIHVNGTWWNSANPSAGTGGQSITAAADTTLGYYLFAVSDRSTNRSYVYDFNFGNGYFGTTAVASAGTNASGNGVFEFDVPTGFTALSTKGLNE